MIYFVQIWGLILKYATVEKGFHEAKGSLSISVDVTKRGISP